MVVGGFWGVIVVLKMYILFLVDVEECLMDFVEFVGVVVVNVES